MSDVTYGTWSIAACPLTIEYSLVVLEEIRHEVADGFQKLSRGGIEVGGLLYGVHEGQTVRIMAIRPASCEHAGGPAFRLSERDRAALADQLRQDHEDARLDGLVCVGWYVSHTRTEIALTESDQEIFSTYFTQPWQATLVVRPSRGGNMRAGFFVRESDGTVNAGQSYLEFAFPDRLAAFDYRSTLTERKAPEHRGAFRGTNSHALPPLEVPRPAPPSSDMTSLFGEPAAVPAPLSKEVPAPANGAQANSYQMRPVPAPSASKNKKWIWLVAALVIAILGVGAFVGTRFLTVGLANETIALRVLEREGQLDIEWNPGASPIAKAVRGTLEIADGPETRTIPLAPPELTLGKFSYKRDTGDLQVRMIVEGPDGKKVQEASRFLGPPPAKESAEELKTLQQRRDELEAEVTRLKQSNDQQAQRIQQLERTLKILQTRPGIN